MEYVMYLLKSIKTDKYYIGSTNNLTRRLSEHKEKESKYTQFTGPYELVFTKEFDTLTEARKAEIGLKNKKAISL